MKRLAAVILGLSCCAGSAYAAGTPARAEVRPNLATPAALGGVSYDAYDARAALLTDHPTSTAPFFDEGHQRSRDFDLGAFALKVGYIGSLLLTADQIVRSVDSVMDQMSYEAADGSRFRFTLAPESEGVEVMLRVSRPLDFN